MLLVRVRLHGLQARQNRRRSLLQEVNTHQHVAVAAEGAPVCVIHLAPLSPVLDDEGQLHETAVDGAVVSQ